MKDFQFKNTIKSPQKWFLITALLVAQFGFAQNKPDAEFEGVIGKTLAESKEY